MFYKILKKDINYKEVSEFSSEVSNDLHRTLHQVHF